MTSTRTCNITLAIVSIGSIGFGCKAADDQIFANDSEGMGDTGITIPDVDLPAEGEADVPLPPGECIQAPLDGTFGYWHQCFGNIQVSFEAEYNGKQYSGSDILKFGPGQENPGYWTEPDDYALPLVAACCGPFDYEDPTTEEKIPYVNSCLFDAVQQVCVGLPHFIRKQAGETDVGDGKVALDWLAGKIEDNTADCVWGLWEGGPPGPNGGGVNQLWGTSWSPPGTPATLTIVESEVNDWTVPGDVPELTPCYGIYDNDAAIVPTAPFSTPGTVGATTHPLVQNSSASAEGPWSSTAEFTLLSDGSSMSVGLGSSGAPVVSGLRLEAASSAVSVGGQRGVIKGARLVLAAPLEPMVAGGEHTIAAGDAVFTAVLSLEGDSRIVAMRNLDPLVFRYHGDGWQFDPVELVYDDPGVGQWTLYVDGLDFGGRAPN